MANRKITNRKLRERLRLLCDLRSCAPRFSFENGVRSHGTTIAQHSHFLYHLIRADRPVIDWKIARRFRSGRILLWGEAFPSEPPVPYASQGCKPSATLTRPKGWSNDVRRDLTAWRIIRSLALVVATGLAVAYGIRRIHERDWNLQPTFQVRAGFRTIGGVEVGSKIRIQGIDAGLVEAITPPTIPGRPVLLTFRIDERLRSLIRSDTTAKIVLQGVIGSKVVELVPGRPDAPPLAASALLPAEDPIELADLVNEASKTLKRVDIAARSAEAGMNEIATVASSIRGGKGTLGKLVVEDEVYRKLVTMSEHGT